MATDPGRLSMHYGRQSAALYWDIGARGIAPVREETLFTDST